MASRFWTQLFSDKEISIAIVPDKKSNFKYYCSDWCRQNWNYEEQADLFYVSGMKQEKCLVCGKELLGRQLKYCSKACYFAGRHNLKREITGADIKILS